MFIGRKQELQFLEDKYNSKGGQLVVLYGRRRVGKTEPLDLLIDEIQKENTSDNGPPDQIIAAGRNYRMSVIAATQQFQVKGKLKSWFGNFDTKVILKPTNNDCDAVLRFLNLRNMSQNFLKQMRRDDCIVAGNL